MTKSEEKYLKKQDNKEKFVAAGGCSFIIVLTAFIALSDVFAETYYVAPDGLDSGSGQNEAPWKTIQRGVNALKAGDSLIVRSGRYVERVDLKGLHGSRGNEIIVRGEPGAILDGEGQLLSLFYTYQGGSRFVIDGFECSSYDGNPNIIDTSNPLGTDNQSFTSDDGLMLPAGSPLCIAGRDGKYIGAYSCGGEPRRPSAPRSLSIEN